MRLFGQALTSFIVIPSQKAKVAIEDKPVETTFPGTEVFRRRLTKLGVEPDKIEIPGDYVFHTRAEGDAYVQLAKKREWKSAVAIMHPHQCLRAMLGLLKSFTVCQHDMDILPVCPLSVNWQKPVHGSQGELLLPRHKHIQQEWDRIIRYQAKGDLASFGELDDYLSRSLT